MPKLTRQDIREVIGDLYFVRGRDYFQQGKVLFVEILNEADDAVELSGSVQGRGRKRYEQRVRIEWTAYGVDIDGECSCPMDYNCKHVAAVCMEYKEGAPRSGLSVEEMANADLSRWLDKLVAAGRQPEPESGGESLLFLLKYFGHQGFDGLEVTLRLVKRRRHGEGYTKGRSLPMHSLAYGYGMPAGLVAEDTRIVTLLKSLSQGYAGGVLLQGEIGWLSLGRMLATGRCHWETVDGPLLEAGDSRALSMDWQGLEGRRQQLVLGAGDGVQVFLSEPACYLDLRQRALGPLESPGLSPAQLEQLRSTPVLDIQRAEAFSRILMRDYPGLKLPSPVALSIRELSDLPFHPVLLLTGMEFQDEAFIHVLLLEFDYGEHRLAALPAETMAMLESPGGLSRIHRDPTAEAEALTLLKAQGFDSLPLSPGYAGPHPLYLPGPGRILSASHWSRFLSDVLPDLEARGWRVEFDESFALDFSSADWQTVVDEPAVGGDWFDLRFDLEVEGRSLPLLPLIASLLESDVEAPLPEFISFPLDAISDAPEDAHRYVNLPGKRLEPVLETLRELHQRLPASGQDVLRLSRFEAPTLNALELAGNPVNGGEALREMARRLENFAGIQPAPVPAGLRAELRPYQVAGLSWLQFLREYRLAGILADDMGLGKTVQVLAHLLLEKQQGRLNQPALIVAPTSLMGNWRREAERFTPDLDVLVLHGPGRREHFASLADYDLVLTTYPLLPRDQQSLNENSFSFLILDEAQNIKNPKSKAASVVRTLPAEHRLCMTGTPLENHLGELWAQLDFLLPGLLGEQSFFSREWRKPIEVSGDVERQRRLSRRVAPFMLRRGKQEVLDELPEKTEIIRSVPLGREQAALYESIRLSMEKRVREAIATQGLARSHITILDALLKLRQVCCDPRLVPLRAAAQVHASAKLDLLMDILPEQLEEGRRILLFSQFTSMLGLIEERLRGQGIGYTKLTGQTRKREAAIERFRSGEVDVFLISLKAGGVGLNLTEADTVILYDPWWNPAVENQAADRAHRIGQDKHVFVYKLIIEDTVEEKILAMQARKQALADGLYQQGEGGVGAGFSAEELQKLLTAG